MTMDFEIMDRESHICSTRHGQYVLFCRWSVARSIDAAVATLTPS
jgi:hypothetical protein